MRAATVHSVHISAYSFTASLSVLLTIQSILLYKSPLTSTEMNVDRVDPHHAKRGGNHPMQTDLIAHLVGMAHGDGLGGEQECVRHRC